jgi:hypothetical protein
MREEPDVRPLHQVALTAALFFAGLPQAPRRSLDVLGRKGKSPGAVHMARWFRWTLPMRNVTTFPVIWAGARGTRLKPAFSPAHYPYVLQRQDTSSCHLRSGTRLTPV